MWHAIGMGPQDSEKGWVADKHLCMEMCGQQPTMRPLPLRFQALTAMETLTPTICIAGMCVLGSTVKQMPCWHGIRTYQAVQCYQTASGPACCT